VGAAACRWWLRGEYKKKIEEVKARNEHLVELNDRAQGRAIQAQQDLEASKTARRAAESERDEARDVAQIRADRITALEQAVEDLKSQGERKQAVIDGPEADALAVLARLEAENRDLAEAKQSLDGLVQGLRTELAQVKGELAHAAKWLKVFDEENARLAESGSRRED
jgi:hypothetical protein